MIYAKSVFPAGLCEHDNIKAKRPNDAAGALFQAPRRRPRVAVRQTKAGEHEEEVDAVRALSQK